MPKPHNPRQGSMQFWPRKRSSYTSVRVRSWASENQVKPLGFIGYKAGMTHILVTDNRPKSFSKGDKISMPVSIIECPPMTMVGVTFYKNTIDGLKKITTISSEKFNKHLSRAITVPKKQTKKLDDVKEFDSLRIVVHSNPAKTGIGSKKPKILELAVGGSKEDQLTYIKEHLGKEIPITDVFSEGNQVDVHGVTKGKGFQGTVKRFGVPIRQHKGEKVKRGIGNLGAWTPKRVDFRVPQSGKMGYHLRTEHNKQIIKMGEDGKEVSKNGGIQKYGIVKNNYILMKGSVVGPRNRVVVMVKAIRPNKKITKDAPEVNYISLT